MKLECGGGFVAVPRDAVAVNGFYFEHLNTAADGFAGPFVLLLPSGRAAMNENGSRPFVYRDADEVLKDAAVLREIGGPW